MDPRKAPGECETTQNRYGQIVVEAKWFVTIFFAVDNRVNIPSEN